MLLAKAFISWTVLVLRLEESISQVTGPHDANTSNPCANIQGEAFSFKNTCYVFVGTDSTWSSARSICHQMSGMLIRVTDRETQGWLSDKLNSYPAWTSDRVWIGANDISVTNTWRWEDSQGADGPLISYSLWYGNTQSAVVGSHCVYLQRQQNWTWFNDLCGSSYKSVCRIDFSGGSHFVPFGVCDGPNKSFCYYLGLGLGLPLGLIITILAISIAMKRRIKTHFSPHFTRLSTKMAQLRSTIKERYRHPKHGQARSPAVLPKSAALSPDNSCRTISRATLVCDDQCDNDYTVHCNVSYADGYIGFGTPIEDSAGTRTHDPPTNQYEQNFVECTLTDESIYIEAVH